MFVKIYGRMTCPYCVRAKNLAEKLKNNLDNFDYEFIDMIELGMSKEDIADIINRPVQTVPQVVIDDQPIGGCTDFQAYAKQHFGIEV